MTIELSEYVIDAIADAVVKKMQKPKTGHWISDAIQGEIDGQIVKAFICSECGAISVFRTIDGKIVNGDLCPNCGVKMESEKINCKATKCENCQNHNYCDYEPQESEE